MNAKKSSYNLSADVIRVLAILGVVIIHTANAVYGRPDFFGGVSWWLAIVLNSISRASIPLFIMVSGYFILAINEPFKKTVNRTINRLAIPLIFWFLFYVVWNFGNPTFEYLDFSLIYRLFTVNVLFLYFFIILIGLYLASPLIRKLINLKISNLKFTILFLAGGSIYYLLQYLFSLCTPAYSLIYWIPFTGLFVAGYTLGSKKLSNLSLPIFGLLISAVSTIIGAYTYYSLSFQGNNLLSDRGCLAFYTDSFLSINVVVMSVSIFVILMNINFKEILHNKLKRLIYSVARSSLGIYVIHIFLLDILDSKLNMFIWITPAWLYLFVKLVVIFTLSYLITLIIMRIPILKLTVGEK